MHTPAIRVAGPGLMLAILLAIVLGAATATAQPKPGDLIVSNGNAISVIDLVSRRITTLATGKFGYVSIGPDNNSIVAIEQGPSPALLRIAPSGARTTITPLSPLGPGVNYSPLVRDQDGSYLVGARNAILRLSPSGVSTLTTNLISRVAGLCRDGDTGDVIAALDYIPFLTYIVRRDAVTGIVTTLATKSRGNVIAHDQATGHFWTSAATSLLFLMDRNTGGFLTTVNPRGYSIGDVVVDQPTSLIFVTGRTNYVTAVLLVSRNGDVVGIYAYLVGNGPGFRSVRMWGSRRLTGTGSGDRGSSYALQVNLPLSAGANYCCALSFAGMRPGIRFPATTAHIARDGLFVATVCGRLPNLTSGFAGKLDANGSANASFRIPSHIPVGTVYTAAAVAVNPAAPGGVDVTEAISVAVTK